MSQKRIFRVLLIIGMIFMGGLISAAFAEKPNNISEFTKVFSGMGRAIAKTNTELQSVNNGAAAAGHIQRLSIQLDRYFEELQKLEEKYPQLAANEEPPSELSSVLQSIQKEVDKISETIDILAEKFENNAEFEQSLARLASIIVPEEDNSSAETE